MKSKIYPVLLVIFTFVLTSVASSQAIPAQTTFYACVKNSSGAIKMTTETKKCTKGSRKISWNNQGPQGQAGAPGEPGPQGVPGDSANSVEAIFLTPSNFSEPWETDATLSRESINGFSKVVWSLPQSNSLRNYIQTTFAIPSSWQGASEVKVTVYWYATSTNGDIVLILDYMQYATGGALDGTVSYGPNYTQTPPATGTVISTSQNFEQIPGVEIMDIGIERYMDDSFQFVDNNPGDVNILAVKVEPVFE